MLVDALTDTDSTTLERAFEMRLGPSTFQFVCLIAVGTRFAGHSSVAAERVAAAKSWLMFRRSVRQSIGRSPTANPHNLHHLRYGVT
jgi:hypothetical protein